MSRITEHDASGIIRCASKLPDDYREDFMREVRYRLKRIQFPSSKQVDEVCREALADFKPTRLPHRGGG
jgi:hypothetical protein